MRQIEMVRKLQAVLDVLLGVDGSYHAADELAVGTIRLALTTLEDSMAMDSLLGCTVHGPMGSTWASYGITSLPLPPRTDGAFRQPGEDTLPMARLRVTGKAPRALPSTCTCSITWEELIHAENLADSICAAAETRLTADHASESARREGRNDYRYNLVAEGMVPGTPTGKVEAVTPADPGPGYHQRSKWAWRRGRWGQGRPLELTEVIDALASPRVSDTNGCRRLSWLNGKRVMLDCRCPACLVVVGHTTVKAPSGKAMVEPIMGPPAPIRQATYTVGFQGSAKGEHTVCADGSPIRTGKMRQADKVNAKSRAWAMAQWAKKHGKL